MVLIGCNTPNAMLKGIFGITGALQRLATFNP
jgi:hypothetical protein